MNHGKEQKSIKYQSNCEQMIRSNENMFRNKFKLTQKIQQLSSTIYERSLSPWARKRNEPLIKTNNIAQQNNSFVNPQFQSHAQTMRHLTNNSQQPSIGDFLRKIQFTKRKPQPKESMLNPQKKNSHSFSQKSPTSYLHDDTVEQDKKLVIYPKQALSLKQDLKQMSNESTVKKHKKKESSDTLVATIQNFYDPFQHKSRQQTIYSIPKGMVKLKLKLKDEPVENKTTPFINPFRMPSIMQRTFRRNSLDQRTNREIIVPIQNQISTLFGSQQKKNFVINSAQKTFFKTHKQVFSRRSITQSTQNNFSEIAPKESHQRNKTTDFCILQNSEPSYCSPTGQAIRRIKLQQKKSRKVKTEVMQTIKICNKESEHIHIRTESDKGTMKQDKEYLYKTFLNYKSQKNSNGHNITKTLNMTFHNKQSFQKNIEKALQLKHK